MLTFANRHNTPRLISAKLNHTLSGNW